MMTTTVTTTHLLEQVEHEGGVLRAGARAVHELRDRLVALHAQAGVLPVVLQQRRHGDARGKRTGAGKVLEEGEGGE